MTKPQETKSYIDLDQVEFKELKEEGVIEGYASTFGNIDRHGDIIEKGAFQGGAKKIPVFALHDPAQTIGTGVVSEDEKGLKIKINLAVNAKSENLRKRAEEYYDLARLGIVERMSIGFAPLETDFETRKVQGKESIVRVIKKVDLMEVSLVPIPANDEARIVQVKTYGEPKKKLIPEVQEEKPINHKSTYLGALIAKQFGVF